MKFCSGCNLSLPLTAYYVRASGTLSSKCKPCVADVVKARQRLIREQKLAQMEPWKREHADRQRREQDARRTAKEYRRTTAVVPQDTVSVSEGHRRCLDCAKILPLDAFPIKTGDKRHPRCKPCNAASHRERYRRTNGGKPRGHLNPERQRQIAERVDHLAAMLKGTAAGEWISTQEGWDMTASELSKLWLLSGDKECGVCGEMVPPQHMQPPGPGNFYPGQCRPCAHAASDRSSIATFGSLPRPIMLPMLDGTEITIGEFARRHRAREAGRPQRAVTFDAN